MSEKQTLAHDDSLSTGPSEIGACALPVDGKQAEDKPDKEKEMMMLLNVLSGLSNKLDHTAEYIPGYSQTRGLIKANERRFERLCIFMMLIPAFVMSILATHRLSNTSYNFDLSELEKKDVNILANQNFERWNSALLSRNNAMVTELYATDVSFLPTLSDEFAVSERSEDRYFMHFVEKQPTGIIMEDKVQPMGHDAYLHAGLYDFVVIDPKKGPTLVKARFTFMWRKFCDETQNMNAIIPGIGPDKKCWWRIVHHHSSMMPSSCVKCAPGEHAVEATTNGNVTAPGGHR